MSIKETFAAGQTREFYGDGDFFRLLETTAEITVEFYKQGREVAEAIGVQAGYAEYFRVTQFDRIRIYSATAQDVKWVIREGSDVRYDRGAASVTGTVALDSATLAALENPFQETGNFVNSAAVAANTPLTVIAPGSNVNGIILLQATGHYLETLSVNGGFIKKTGAAPATIFDGQMVAQLKLQGYGTPGYFGNIDLTNAVFIEPGAGLYYISNVATTATQSFRACRYKLL